MGGDLAYIFADWPHTAVDPTPLGFAIASLLWRVGVFSRALVDVSPVARFRVVSAIDDTIVESHGWDIRVTAGDEGGARFEIRTG